MANAIQGAEDHAGEFYGVLDCREHFGGVGDWLATEANCGDEGVEPNPMRADAKPTAT